MVYFVLVRKLQTNVNADFKEKCKCVHRHVCSILESQALCDLLYDSSFLAVFLKISFQNVIKFIQQMNFSPLQC